MEAVRTKKAQKSSLVATLGELNQEQVSQNSILWLESSLILALFIVGGKRQGHPGSPEDDWGSEPGKLNQILAEPVIVVHSNFKCSLQNSERRN